MAKTPGTPQPNGRCVALFPGAFRPPHRAHYTAVQNLSLRPDVDEVVIIITNRSRHIPGTTKALAPGIAKQVWEVYLKDLDKVRVEIAPGSATQQALAYIEQAGPNDHFLFCLGDKDLAGDGNRSHLRDDLSRPANPKCTVIPTPTPPLPGGATAVRADLARGEAGRESFLAAIPQHLDYSERERVWEICSLGMREMSDIAMEKIRELLPRHRIGDIRTITCAKNGKTDPVFRIQLEGGGNLFVKYANDTEESASIDRPNGLKPRKRLSVERRALRYIAEKLPANIEIPEVIYHSKATKILALSEVCPGGKQLQDQLQRGRFSRRIATDLGGFLATCHSETKDVTPLWGSKAADTKHWQAMLRKRTTDLRTDVSAAALTKDLESLYRLSDAAADNRYLHLDIRPKNILIGESRLGIIDFELGSGIGDPAYDLGGLLGHYVYWGIATGAGKDCHEAIDAAIQAYATAAPEIHAHIQSRVIGFAGACLLELAIEAEAPTNSQSASTAQMLLANHEHPPDDAGTLLGNCMMAPPS